MQAAAYTDFGALAGLRTDARQNADGSLREVAEQFESLFVQMMLKAMRDATPEGGLFDSNALDNYEQMYDQQLAVELSANGGIGLADVIEQQLSAHTARRPEAPESGFPLDQAAPVESAGFDLERADASSSQSIPPATPLGVSSAANDAPRGVEFDGSPEEFLAVLRPLAERVAGRLGVAPEVLLAQAALETGWGRRISADAQGSSNNLFNIKADDRWSGATTTVATVEYRDGLAVREIARFRAYDSPGASFEDYAAFIEGSARYQPALDRADDGWAYLQELQRAGYATDPAYAEKIQRIVDGAHLSGESVPLKQTSDLPLTS